VSTITMTRRVLLTAPALLVAAPRVIEAATFEINYRLWMGDYAQFKPSKVAVVLLNKSYGTASDYGEGVLLQGGIRPLFFFTGRVGVGPWHGFLTGAVTAWAEFVDLRTGDIATGKKVKFYKFDRIDVRFWDGSSVQVELHCVSCSDAWQVVYGTERNPDGTLLNADRANGCRTRECRGTRPAPTHVNGVRVFALSWSWSSNPEEWES
jgi:hypothetical protein